MTRHIPDSSEPPYYVKGLALGIPAYLIGIHLWTWVLTLPTFLGGRADFRQLYTAGYMLRLGAARQLYEYDAQLHFQNLLVSQAQVPLPYIRPAFEALLFIPFSYLHYRAAYFAFLALNLVQLALCYGWLRPRMHGMARIYPWLPAAMFLGFLPIAAALIQGQDSLLLLTLLVAAYLSLERGNELTAGILTGAGLFKFQIVLPLALLFVIWRRWRFSIGFALSAFLAATMSLLVVGWDQSRLYVGSLISMSGGLKPLQFRYPIPLPQMPNLHGLICGLAPRTLPGFWATAATIAASSAVLITVAIVAGRRERRSDAFLIAITASTVVSYYLLIHDLSVILIPLVVILSRTIGAEDAGGDARDRRVARASALMFVAPVCMSYIPDQFFIVCLPLLGFLLAMMSASIPTRPRHV